MDPRSLGRHKKFRLVYVADFKGVLGPGGVPWVMMYIDRLRGGGPKQTIKQPNRNFNKKKDPGQAETQSKMREYYAKPNKYSP